MPGVRGKPGENLRYTLPKGTEVLLTEAGATLGRADGAAVLPGEVSARAVVFYLASMRRCPACVAKLPCDYHGAGAHKKALAELGLVQPPAEPPDPNGEHQKLVDQWWKAWKAAFDKFPALTKTHHARLKQARHEHGYELLAEAIEGAFMKYRETKSKADIPEITFVLNNPSRFAAMKRSASRGTLQGGADTWGGG